MECENLSAKEIEELLNYSDGKEILSQAQIDELLQRIDEGKQKLKSICEKKSGDTRKVKTFDFKRPDILGNRSLRNLTIIMEDFSCNLTDFLQREYGFKAKVNVNSVDQLTREEFVHCIPIPSFISAASWIGGYIALNMNPNTFLYGILKRKPVPDRYKNLSFKEKLEKAKELATPCNNDLEVVSNIYNHVINTVTYDYKKAETVQSGYLPNPDDTLATHTGICLDYACLMASMLRSQRIPTHMEVGYAGEVYHAWISTYIQDIGWVNGIIQFDGINWSLMDPTFASSTDAKELKKFIGDGSNYSVKYIY